MAGGSLSTVCNMPNEVTMLLWDVDPATLDLEKHKTFLVERVLNMGDEVALRWLWQRYGRGAIYETVITSPRLTLKTARCWQNYFVLKEEQMKCFSTFSASLGSVY